MVTDVSKIYCDHFAIHTNIESLSRPLGAYNVIRRLNLNNNKTKQQ